MALVHVKKVEVNDSGRVSWRLYGPGGVQEAVFDAFSSKIKDLAFDTRDRYSTVVARFIDYLYDVRVLGGPPVTRAKLNLAIEDYLGLLKSGDGISLAIPQAGGKQYLDGDQAREEEMRGVARRLGITPLAVNSWANTLAPLNRFLTLCATLEQESKEMAILRGGIEAAIVQASEWDPRPLLEAVDGVTAFSREEIHHLKHSTMLGGVIRFRGAGLTRPKGLRKSSRQQSQVDVNSLDFPEEHFPSLLATATSWRDRALWTLEYASGIRRSEGLNLQWCDIDFQERQVYVLDPELLRYGRDITPRERELRFKGRTVSWTYLRQPYRDWFFEFLRNYRRQEYRLPMDGNDYVFQYLISPHYGRPLVEATDQTLNSAFTTAVQRAKIPGPPIDRSHLWTSHSLRHGFAKYMINKFRVPGQQKPGLTEAEVQLLLGHKSIASTRKYAKLNDDWLKEKLLAHDRQFIAQVAPAPVLSLPRPDPLALA